VALPAPRYLLAMAGEAGSTRRYEQTAKL